MPHPQPEQDTTLLFRAMITPYRSLSPRGLRWLLAAIAAMGGLVSLRFWFLGAWPIVGFAVVEVALAAVMLWLNHRSGRDTELVTLHPDRVQIVRTVASGGREEKVLPSAWLTVSLQERPGRTPLLELCHRGQREEIAAALGEEEKRDLAAAIRQAVWDLHNPRFENPQLHA